MSLPPKVEHRVWWMWPAGEPVKRRQFAGKNFYWACEKAKVAFGIESTRLGAELCHPDDIEGLTAAEKERRDPWASLSQKKQTRGRR